MEPRPRRPKQTPAVPHHHHHHHDPALLGSRWARTQEMLHLRERLMRGNAEEIEALLVELTDFYEGELEGRNRRIAALEREGEALRETVTQQTDKINAQRDVLEETEKRSKARLAQLGAELDETRSELLGLAQSTKELVGAHNKTKLRLVEMEKLRRDADAECDRLRKQLLTERENANRATSDAAFMRAQLDQNQRDAIEINARMYRLEKDNEGLEGRLAQAARADNIAESRRIEQLTETVRQLHANNTRLLRIMEQIGVSCGSSGDGELSNALRLFSFIRGVGGDEFRFIGDAALMSAAPYSLFASERLAGIAPMLAQDLRTAILEHQVIGKRPVVASAVGGFAASSNAQDRRRAASSVAKPANAKRAVYDADGTLRGTDYPERSGRFVPRGASEADPIVRLRTERDFWIPTPIVHFVSQFRARYFADAPLDLFYTLLVEVARLFREHSGIAPSTSAAAAAAAAATKAKFDLPASRKGENHGDGGGGGGLPSSRRRANLSTKDVLKDYVALDAVRCVAGLRSLVSGLSSGSALTPNPEVRDILTASLRTVESLLCRVRRLETETGVEDELKTTAVERTAASVMDAIAGALDRASITILGECGKCTAQLRDAAPMLEYLTGKKKRKDESSGSGSGGAKAASNDVGVAVVESVRVLQSAQQAGLDAIHGAMLALRDAVSKERARLAL